MSAIDSVSSHQVASPAAHRDGIVITENGGITEITRMNVLSGVCTPKMPTKNDPTRRIVSGAVMFCSSSCRDTSAAAAANRQL